MFTPFTFLTFTTILYVFKYAIFVPHVPYYGYFFWGGDWTELNSFVFLIKSVRFKLPEINNILFQSQSVTVYTCMALKSSNSITTCNYWGFKTLHFITIVTVFGIPHKFSILSKGELENKMKCFYQIIWVYALEKKANSNTLRNQWKIKGAIKSLMFVL